MVAARIEEPVAARVKGFECVHLELEPRRPVSETLVVRSAKGKRHPPGSKIASHGEGRPSSLKRQESETTVLRECRAHLQEHRRMPRLAGDCGPDPSLPAAGFHRH